MQGRALLVAGVMVAAMTVPVTAASAVDDINTNKLRQAVTVGGIMTHERVLQRIANNNDGTRASGTPGYTASADYVKKTLKKAGYKISEQEFAFPYYQEVTPATLTQLTPVATPIETESMQYSGSGEVSGALIPTINLVIPATPEPSSASGCAVSDFVPASATEPQVALIQRGTCTFADKVANAVAAGYDAAVILNEGNPGRTELLSSVTLGAPAEIPVVGISYDDGVSLYNATLAGPVTVAVATDIINETRTTTNIIADSPKGNADKTVVVGAHLDSVLAGAGINDNGSGTSVLLETAIQMSKQKIKPRQMVRFAFWGAEESGLLGSEHYVASLSNEQLSTIYANLNFDMLGSTNYVRFVYDGDGSADPAGAGGPPGSAQIESVFTDYFAGKGLASSPTAFDGRSDYGPFIAAGIPAGGLFSGAEGIKTADEAAVYGGTAGAPYDPCYHEACDTVTNLSTAALNELGDATVHAVMTLTMTKSGFFEDGSRMAQRKQISVEDFDYSGSHLVR